MKIGKTFYSSKRKDWRSWLKKHYKKEKEIWLVIPTKASGKPRIAYNDAVEEALCFGWIDSQAKSIDKNAYAQRFSPRNLKTGYSEANKVRLKKLLKQGKVIKPLRDALSAIIKKKYAIPSDILKKIKTNKLAWEHFKKFSPAYKRIRTGFINGARNRPKEYRKRLEYFIKMTEKGKMFGFGGIEKHY